MDDKEKIQSFGDMVDATEKMSAPWRKVNLIQLIALVLTNLFWAIIVGMLVYYAYMTPIEVTQNQDLTEQQQTQEYSSGVTDGN